MSRWRIIAAWVLLALWVPATSHCAMEAAGLLEVGECCHAEDEPVEAASDCSTVDRDLSITNAANAVAAPVLFFAYALAESGFSAGLIQVDAVRPIIRERPGDWLPAWNFEHRTAPPARAPSLS